ncbi:hypothetical protein D3C71_1504200 [compost metagenome]
MWTFLFTLLNVLWFERGHPGPISLSFTREEIGIEDSNEFTVVFTDLKCLYFFVVGIYCIDFLEVDAKQAMGYFKCTL